jgi:hypothetical protein
MQYDTRQRLRALVRFYHRYARHLAGIVFPDPRDQELRDRGLELEWRLRVRRREISTSPTIGGNGS